VMDAPQGWIWKKSAAKAPQQQMPYGDGQGAHEPF